MKFIRIFEDSSYFLKYDKIELSELLIDFKNEIEFLCFFVFEVFLFTNASD